MIIPTFAPLRAPHDTLLTRVRGEYQAMPGLRLTSAQVQRLCGVEQALCQMALDVLVDEKFLCVNTDGRYARLTDAMIHRPHPAKADIRTAERAKQAS